MDERKHVNIREFDIQKMPLSCTWIIVGPPASGKSSLIEQICYYNKHKYPVARVFVGTVEGYKQACNIFGDLYVSPKYDEAEERAHINRQRTVCNLQQCACENKKTCPHAVGTYAINIIDDASDDPKVFKTKTMKALFKLGSQHYNQLLLVGLQYAIDMPIDIRPSVSYVAIFRQPGVEQRQRLYKNFGGPAGSYENFCDLMEQLTGNYNCLIIKQRSLSNRLEDNIFYLQTKLIGPWRFGCQEFREWNRKRFNPSYREPVDDV